MTQGILNSDYSPFEALAQMKRMLELRQSCIEWSEYLQCALPFVRVINPCPVGVSLLEVMLGSPCWLLPMAIEFCTEES